LDKKKYNVYYMYSAAPVTHSNGSNRLNGRRDYLENTSIHLIEFESKKTKYNQTPDIFTVIHNQDIDLVIAAGGGIADFPINLVRNIPIIMINVFGDIAIQKNIRKHICISKEVQNKITPVIDIEKTEIIPILSELPVKNFRELGEGIRNKFNIKKTDIVFGRIGRPDNAIFDPIGINAFKQLTISHPDIHYIVMAPPKILIQKVKQENIPRVYFLNSSSKEEDIWAFHGSIDVLAHFRQDGESFGLNIAESMLAGNPIISHVSHMWNAHLEYLDDSFSRVAGIDDAKTYAEHMEFMIKRYKENKLKKMGENARKKAEKLFYVKSRMQEINKIISDVT